MGNSYSQSIYFGDGFSNYIISLANGWTIPSGLHLSYADGNPDSGGLLQNASSFRITGRAASSAQYNLVFKAVSSSYPSLMILGFGIVALGNSTTTMLAIGARELIHSTTATNFKTATPTQAAGPDALHPIGDSINQTTQMLSVLEQGNGTATNTATLPPPPGPCPCRAAPAAAV